MLTLTPSFPFLTPSDAEVLQFDFTNYLAPGETLTGLPVIQVRDDAGFDSFPENIVRGESISADGVQVLVVTSGYTLNSRYHLTVTAQTTNSEKVRTLAGILPIQSA